MPGLPTPGVICTFAFWDKPQGAGTPLPKVTVQAVVFNKHDTRVVPVGRRTPTASTRSAGAPWVRTKSVRGDSRIWTTKARQCHGHCTKPGRGNRCGPTTRMEIMENQHRKITGYRELTQEEIDLMNEIKAIFAKVGELCDRVDIVTATLNDGGETNALLVKQAQPYRWASIARTHAQEASMALTRAVAKPTFF